MPRELYEELVIPTAEIAVVLDWIKAEQVRVIQKDRTLGTNKIQKLDWLTETVENILILCERVEADQKKIVAENEMAVRINAREAEAAACTCRPGCSCKDMVTW